MTAFSCTTTPARRSQDSSAGHPVPLQSADDVRRDDHEGARLQDWALGGLVAARGGAWPTAAPPGAGACHRPLCQVSVPPSATSCSRSAYRRSRTPGCPGSRVVRSGGGRPAAGEYGLQSERSRVVGGRDVHEHQAVTHPAERCACPPVSRALARVSGCRLPCHRSVPFGREQSHPCPARSRAAVAAAPAHLDCLTLPRRESQEWSTCTWTTHRPQHGASGLWRGRPGCR